MKNDRELKDAIKLILDNELIVTNGITSLYWASMDEGQFIITKDVGEEDNESNSDSDKEFYLYDDAFDSFIKDVEEEF